MALAHLNRIGTAVPQHDVHELFVDWARTRVADRRARALFERMAKRSGIAHRWSVLSPSTDGNQLDRGGFYADMSASTAARMLVYAEEAPKLALAAIAKLGPLGAISHLVVASCTGFVAPGVDQIVARALGLPRGVERTLVGFMGCYAAIAALRTAHHIVRSEPEARVLVVTVELCTLHLQDTAEVEPLLAMLQFGDGAAAAIVSAEPEGLAIVRVFAEAIADAHELITWTIGDKGFVMELAGAVPNRIAAALGDTAVRETVAGNAPVDAWAVHAGGRSVLDAVERALDLPADALARSRTVLADKGNMSSATLMFVLASFLEQRRPIANGVAVAFGPGLAAEGFGFRSAA